MKKKNPIDTTLRNNRATRKQIAGLKKDIAELQHDVAQLCMIAEIQLGFKGSFKCRKEK